MLPVNSRKIEMSDVETLREKRGLGDSAGFYISDYCTHYIRVKHKYTVFYSPSNFPAYTRRGG